MLSLGLITHEPTKVYEGGVIAPYILNLGTRWRCPFHAPADLILSNKSTVPIGYESAWAPGQVWRLWRRDTVLPLHIIEQIFLSLAVCSIVAIPSTVYQAVRGKSTFKRNLAVAI
jgi:hypothetical protein